MSSRVTYGLPRVLDGGSRRGGQGKPDKLVLYFGFQEGSGMPPGHEKASDDRELTALSFASRIEADFSPVRDD